jgi:hypothetical protein
MQTKRADGNPPRRKTVKIKPKAPSTFNEESRFQDDTAANSCDSCDVGRLLGHGMPEAVLADHIEI